MELSDANFVTDVFSFAHNVRPQIDLSGTWEFHRDADEQGGEQGWHRGDGAFEQAINIPGAPQAQGIGEPVQRQKTYFSEPFWVRRAFTLPEVSARQRVWLRIGGILPAADIYLNGQHVGYTKSSRTQQRVDVTGLVRPGAENLIAIKVCNAPEVRLDGIWEMAECATTWSGVYRHVTCEITDRVSLIDLYAQPQLDPGAVHVSASLSEATTEPAELVLRVMDGETVIGSASVALPAEASDAEATVDLADFTSWSPAHPQLYSLDVQLLRAESREEIDRVRIRFGMREVSVSDTKFFLNGTPIFMRFFGENQYYPETLCPPADKDWYLKRLKRARAYGMNGAKGCVEALPQEFIEAADEAGIMIIQEMPFGLSGLRANKYTIDERFMKFYSAELEGMVKESRNHASIIAYSMTSEMSISSQTQTSFDFFNRTLVQKSRRLAPHALAIDCTGYVNTEDTARGKRDTDFYALIIPTWMKQTLDETPIQTDGRHPAMLHEYSWWSCYPDPADKPKYADKQLVPFWLDTLVASARKNGQEALIPTYRENSLWLQALCRKDGIEYSRRSPGVEGYLLWLLVDFGQYCEGLFDDFWRPKNVTAEEFLKSNGDTVILLAQEGDRCLKMGAETSIPLAVSHYGEEELEGCTLRWRTSGGVVLSGEIPIAALDQGALTQVGGAQLPLPISERACRFELHTSLEHNGRVINTNEWSFWAFPQVEPSESMADSLPPEGKTIDGAFVRMLSASSAPIPPDASLVVADTVDEAFADYIVAGGKGLLLAQGVAIENTAIYAGSRTFYTAFRTIPWNAGTSGNSGTVIAPHPALRDFPHEGKADLQFLHMIRGILPMEFEPLREHNVQPIIRSIDHYAANRNNAYMLEFHVGEGSVLVTTLAIAPNLGRRIEADYLLDCLADYARGPDFQPEATVPRADLLELFVKRPEE